MERQYCEQTGKVCFSQRDAGNAVRVIKGNRGRKRKSSTLPTRYYLCQFCGTFHLTHFRNKHRSRKSLAKLTY